MSKQQPECEIGFTFKHCITCFSILPFEPNAEYFGDIAVRPLWACENCGQLQDFTAEYRYAAEVEPRG